MTSVYSDSDSYSDSYSDCYYYHYYYYYYCAEEGNHEVSGQR